VQLARWLSHFRDASCRQRQSGREMPLTSKRIAAILALLCLGILGRLLMHLSFGTLLGGAGFLFLIAMSRELWFAEKAHRSSEHEREEHLIREREFARARLRERGD
jgi:hypothetical protein